MNIPEARNISEKWYEDPRVKKAIYDHLGLVYIVGQESMRQVLRDPAIAEMVRCDYAIVSNPTIYAEKGPVPARSIDVGEIPTVLEYDPFTEIGYSLRNGLREENDKPRELKLYWDIESYSTINPSRQLYDQLGFFQDMEAAYLEVTRILQSYSIDYLSTMTGRGYHIMTSINRDSSVFGELLELGKKVEPEVTMHQQEAVQFSKQKYPLPKEFEQLFRAGIFLQQFVFLSAMKNYRDKHYNLRVDISDTGDEGIAFDNTCALRHAGTAKYAGPGSPYVKPLLHPYKFGGDNVVDQTPLLFRIIKESMQGKRDLPHLIHERQDKDRAAGNLAEMGTSIPISKEEGIRKLIADYKRSPLFNLQKQLEQYDQIDPEDQWQSTYRNYEAIKWQYPEIGYILDQPNPLLLQPDALRHIILTFADRGWPPIHIAGFLNAAYTNPDIDWGRQFERHNPRIRHAIGWVYLVLSEALMK